MTTQPVSSSPSSFSSFTHNSSCTYDVFLSFRGEDTRTNFTDHLHEALVRKGIRTFIDGELVRGEEISPALVKAIEESRISLIVFSENYASSRWCLDELVRILQCKQSKQQVVLPIFYKLDPSDVRKQTSKFGDAFEGLIESKFKDNEEKVLIWREALTKTANLSGHTFKDGEYETTFINNIVYGILSQVLSRTYWNVAKHPVGIQSHVQYVKKLLDVGGKDRRMVGIWGTSGIGKTTIAKAIWNAIAHQFEGSCFLSNVRENSMSDGDLIKLQEALLHNILGGEWKIHSVDAGIGVIKERLSHKKILLILDDVNQLKQLDNLASVGWFGEGSRVITTTQDSGLLKCHGIDLIYEVQMLYDDRALELFSLNAFGKSEPPNDYLELAKRAIAYAQGIPLALTLLGSHLRNKDKDRWQNILDSYEGEPYTGIQETLRKSYDALEKSVQQVFLDIACFFKGEDKDYVLKIVSNSKNKVSRDCIEVLIEKAMITIDYGGIQMHDLLEKLGKDIVHEESPNDPGKRSRLWFYEDVEQVLTESIGTRNIKGIMVKLPYPAEITLNPECFRNMVNLEIFINRNASLCGHINYLPNALRLIDWDRCQLQSLPSNFQGNHLVEFNMPRSHIRQLEGFKNMPMLTYMNLSGCQFLEKIPDLSGIPNIKYLNLWRCTSLVEVDDSVGRLDKLVELNLQGCVRLTRFATRLRLKSLKTLYLIDCKRLESFPEIEVEMESLRSLYISRSGIRELPSSIAYLTGLDILQAENSKLQLCPNLSKFCLKGCSQIRKLERFKHLPKLRRLDLRGCQFLEKIPDLSEIPNIEQLDLSRCTSLVEIDDSIGLLDKLVTLALDGCIKLTRFATRHRLNSLKYLNLGGCKRLESIPELENMPNLVELKLDGCVNLTRFATRHRLISLTTLDLGGCERLESIPELENMPNLVELKLVGCVNLTRFATRHRLNSLTTLDLGGCERLESIPELENMPNLVELKLDGCVNLTRFATRLRLNSLTYLFLRDCKRLESFPELENTPNLVELKLDGCVNLTRFATRLRLNSLKKLSLRDCKRLESFPEIEVEMESLETLDISGSGISEWPSSIAYPTGLQELVTSSRKFELLLRPKQYLFTLRGCNLTKSDFVLPLVFWYTLSELDLSGNNFVNLPRGFSKFVNLRDLNLSDCKSLLEIPEQVLPPKVSEVFLDNCTSLEKIPKVSWVLLDNCTSLEKIPELRPGVVSMYLSLSNCVRLRGYYDITGNIFLNPRFHYDIILPGDEVPKWFSFRKDATLVKEEEEEYMYKIDREEEAGYEVSFEIPPNLKWETLRLVLCVVAKVSISYISFTISLNGQQVNEIYLREIKEGHVWLTCIPLLDPYDVNLSQPLKPGNMCEVEIHFLLSGEVPPDEIACGVHLLDHQVADVSVTEDFYQRSLPEANDDQHQDYESTSLSSASKTSLGKRPRESDFMALDDDHCANALDIGDHEAQWLTLFTHPKRRHIDLNEEPKQ